jgi:hypothetical protein
MVKDGKGRELLIDFSGLPTTQNKGLKLLSDHGVETPMLLCSNSLGTSAYAYSQKYMRNIRFVVLGNPHQIDKNVFTGQAGG